MLPAFASWVVSFPRGSLATRSRHRPVGRIVRALGLFLPVPWVQPQVSAGAAAGLEILRPARGPEDVGPLSWFAPHPCLPGPLERGEHVFLTGSGRCFTWSRVAIGHGHVA